MTNYSSFITNNGKMLLQITTTHYYKLQHYYKLRRNFLKLNKANAMLSKLRHVLDINKNSEVSPPCKI